MRVMTLPDRMGTEGVKLRVTGTDALPETRSSKLILKEDRVRLKQRSNQSSRAETMSAETGVRRSVPEVPSPTCARHLVGTKTSPHAHATPSRASNSDYLAIAIQPPTFDRPTD
jgi:hypothetical protein